MTRLGKYVTQSNQGSVATQAPNSNAPVQGISGWSPFPWKISYASTLCVVWYDNVCGKHGEKPIYPEADTTDAMKWKKGEQK